MFALAKRFIGSGEDQDRRAEPEQAQPSHGFRVIHVDHSSNAFEAGLESYFDFIVGVNGHGLSHTITMGEAPFTAEQSAPIDQFLHIIENSRGNTIPFDVWSAKGRVMRTVYLTIAHKEPVGEDPYTQDTNSGESGAPMGSGSATSTSANAAISRPSLDTSLLVDCGLGVTVQWTPLEASEHVWHVLNVYPNSPAEAAGLISHADYIVGAGNGLLESGGEGLLSRVLNNVVTSSSSNPSLELYVYNHDYDTLRPVTITPNPHWGGSGMLGCGVGYGLLHRLPLVVGKFDANTRPSGAVPRTQSYGYRADILPPGGTLFETEETPSQNQSQDADLVTPVNLDNAAPHLPAGAIPPPPTSHRNSASNNRRMHPAATGGPHLKNSDLSAYFAEEEKRSRELDTPARASPSTDTPPPPPPSKR